MILEVGKGGKARFIRGIKKTNIFEIGEYGMVVERDKNTIYLYATNNRCSQIYSRVTLGDNSLLKGKQFLMVGAFAHDILVLDAKEVMVVVDYGMQRIAVNRPDLEVKSNEGWDRMPWEPHFNAMFGLSVSEAEQQAFEALKNRDNTEEVEELPAPVEPELDPKERFWNWFAENEEDIVDKTLAGGEEAEIITARLRVRLAVVFPYERPENIEFALGGDGEKNRLAVYHFNNDRMKADAESLIAAMPEVLKERWVCETEA